MNNQITPNNKPCENYMQMVLIPSNKDSLKLNVNTATDWATVSVGVGSILSAIMIGCLTFYIQRRQVKSSLAGYRSEWQKTFRESIVSFISISGLIINEIKSDEKYLLSSESYDAKKNLSEARLRVILILDPKKDLSEKIKEKIQEITDLILDMSTDTKTKSDKFDDFCSILLEQSIDIIENTWIDIKKDIGEKIKK